MIDVTLASIVVHNNHVIGKTRDGEEIVLYPQSSPLKWSGITATGESGSNAWLADNGFNLAVCSTRVDYSFPNEPTLTELVAFLAADTVVPGGATLVVALINRDDDVIASVTFAAGESGRKNAGESFTPYLVESGDLVALKVTTTGSVGSALHVTAMAI